MMFCNILVVIGIVGVIINIKLMVKLGLCNKIGENG